MTPITVSVGPGQWASVAVAALDNDGDSQPIHGTITSSDYSKAYVAGNGTAFALIPKAAAPQGGSFVVSATFQAFSADGTALAPVQMDVTVNGTAAAPQATTLQVGTPSVQAIDTLHGTPEDGGSAVVTFS